MLFGTCITVELWAECLRVLKPGGHLLAFSGTRTVHRMVCAIEDAGFEIRDMITWNYGSGFPKSLDVSKAIDKKFGVESEVVGIKKNAMSGWNTDGSTKFIDRPILKGTSEQAKQWSGWGTALKPSIEPICVARKPLSEKTVAENVLKWGVGAINIDGCRVENIDGVKLGRNNKLDYKDTGIKKSWGMKAIDRSERTDGRWPANFIHDGSFEEEWVRYFYCAKASNKDRNEGCENLPLKEIYPQNNSIERKELNESKDNRVANNHPTVKPTDLMAYLCRLVTPPNGTVLDPFNGSGSTGKACMRENFKYIGIDLSQEYLDISKARIEFELSKKNKGV